MLLEFLAGTFSISSNSNTSVAVSDINKMVVGSCKPKLNNTTIIYIWGIATWIETPKHLLRTYMELEMS